MFRGFNLSIDESSFSDYYTIGKSAHASNKSTVKATLTSFLDEDGSLLASKITDNWFPQIKADVFISHSHKDSELAIGLAGWLQTKFQLKTFIDSSVWGYSNDLLKLIDKKYCWQEEEKTYNYDRRNRTNSHVNIMLSTALTQMIDNCECVIFLNTPNSISCEGYVKETATDSPWIYSEIAITKIIEKKSLRPTSELAKSIAMDSLEENLKVKYDLDLGHLAKIQMRDLENWGFRNFVKGSETLDKLYKMTEYR